jgi:hypothetical protein
MGINKTRDNEAKAFEILCNIVDAFVLRDKKMLHRRVMRAVDFLQEGPKDKSIITKINERLM